MAGNHLLPTDITKLYFQKESRYENILELKPDVWSKYLEDPKNLTPINPGDLPESLEEIHDLHHPLTDFALPAHLQMIQFAPGYRYPIPAKAFPAHIEKIRIDLMDFSTTGVADYPPDLRDKITFTVLRVWINDYGEEEDEIDYYTFDQAQAFHEDL
jgi:hypothetical protein